MTLTPKTRLDELIKAYPFLLDFLPRCNPEFEKLRSPFLRKARARVAGLDRVTSIDRR